MMTNGVVQDVLLLVLAVLLEFPVYVVLLRGRSRARYLLLVDLVTHQKDVTRAIPPSPSGFGVMREGKHKVRCSGHTSILVLLEVLCVAATTSAAPIDMNLSVEWTDSASPSHTHPACNVRAKAEYGLMPLMNMWWPHTMKPKKPMDNMA